MTREMHLPIVPPYIQSSTGLFSEYRIRDGLSHKLCMQTSMDLGYIRAFGVRFIPAHFVLFQK